MILHGLSRLTDDSLLWLLPRLAFIPWLLALPEGRTEVGEELGEVFPVGAGDEKDWGKKRAFSSPLCSCSVSAWQWLLRNKGGSGNWFKAFLTNERDLCFKIMSECLRWPSVNLSHHFGTKQILTKQLCPCCVLQQLYFWRMEWKVWVVFFLLSLSTYITVHVLKARIAGHLHR